MILFYYLPEKSVMKMKLKRKRITHHSLLLQITNLLNLISKKIDQDSVNLFSDFKSMLVADSSELQDINIQPEVKDGVDKVKNAYNKLSDKQKLIFMKWLMNN